MKRHTFTRLSRRADRGSTFLIVLSVLTLLVLLAATFTYTSRLEVRAAGNFAQAVQARFAALGGLPAAATVVLDRPGLAVALNQRWADPKTASIPNPQQGAQALSAASRPVDSAEAAAVRLQWTHALQSVVKVQDEGGKIALNALARTERARGEEAIGAEQLDAQDLKSVLQRVAEHYELDEMNPEALSNSILAYLNRQPRNDGATSRTVEARSTPIRLTSAGNFSRGPRSTLRPAGGMEAPEIEDETEVETPGVNAFGILAEDPRFQPTEETQSGDGVRLLFIEELAKLDGMPESREQAQKAIASLSTVLTPYSQSRLAYEASGRLHDALDPNTAQPEQIYDALKSIYPDGDEKRLKQWAVNLIDWRDEDRTPTAYPTSDTEEPIIGWERTPYINEVWPDSLTSETDGDDGEYFEIYNPYEFEIDVNGWTAGVNGFGAAVPLSGVIPPKGFLVVTDDRDNSGDPMPETSSEIGAGSFYDIFGRLGDGAGRRLLQEPMLNLPNESGTLVMRDDKGNLIDSFHYTGMARNGVRHSAQRSDPRIRAWQVRPCTPMSPNTGEEANGKDFAAAIDRDRPVKSVAELFRIPAYLPDTMDQAAPNGVHPRLRESSVALDARLVDIFAIGGERQPQIESARKDNPARTEEAGARPDVDETASADPLRIDEQKTSETVRVAAGRININTAPRPVLLALPGMNEALVDSILSWREGKRTTSSASETDEEEVEPVVRQSSKPPFASISDFMTNDAVWGGMTDEERLSAYRFFANLITVNSQVFQVDSQNRLPQATTDQKPSESRNRVYMIVDAKGRPSALSWRYLD